MPGKRICSMLPSATEMVCALGLEKHLVGVSHECDYPLSVRSLPKVVRPAVDTARLTPEEIDRTVTERLHQGQSLYEIDAPLLQSLRPDLILTQSLCDVCAPSGNQATQVLAALPYKPQVLYLTPHSLDGVWDNLLDVGKATGQEAKAKQIIRQKKERLSSIQKITRSLPPVRAVFLEWVDPLFNGGHWVPEMIRLAGGHDPLANEGIDSVRTEWEAVRRAEPDILLVSPCGFDTAKAAQQLPLLQKRPGWETLPAVQKKQVYALHANAYFARPGPRIVEGVELLASLFHPDHFTWQGSPDAFQQIA